MEMAPFGYEFEVKRGLIYERQILFLATSDYQ